MVTKMLSKVWGSEKGGRVGHIGGGRGRSSIEGGYKPSAHNGLVLFNRCSLFSKIDVVRV